MGEAHRCMVTSAFPTPVGCFTEAVCGRREKKKKKLVPSIIQKAASQHNKRCCFSFIRDSQTLFRSVCSGFGGDVGAANSPWRRLMWNCAERSYVSLAWDNITQLRAAVTSGLTAAALRGSGDAGTTTPQPQEGAHDLHYWTTTYTWAFCQVPPRKC